MWYKIVNRINIIWCKLVYVREKCCGGRVEIYDLINIMVKYMGCEDERDAEFII